MGWLFPDRPKFPRGVPVPGWDSAPEDRRGWNEDWKLGDLAECLAERFIPGGPGDPARGEVLRVTRLGEGVDQTGSAMISAPGFAGKPANQLWACRAFRKLRPAQEPASAEFSAWLREMAGVEG